MPTKYPPKKISTQVIPTRETFGPRKYTRKHFGPMKHPQEKFWTHKVPMRKNSEPMKAQWLDARPTRLTMVQDPHNLAHSFFSVYAGYST